jgi:hypothetical protein
VTQLSLLKAHGKEQARTATNGLGARRGPGDGLCLPSGAELHAQVLLHNERTDIAIKQTDRQTDRQANRQTDRQTDTNSPTHIQTDAHLGVEAHEAGKALCTTNLRQPRAGPHGSEAVLH